jgi:hypothetical protein
VRIDVFIHSETSNDLSNLIRQLTEKVTTMSVALDKLTAEVSRNTAVDESAITLLNGLAQQIRDLKEDPVKLEALATELEGSSARLAEAVTSNTPSA